MISKRQLQTALAIAGTLIFARFAFAEAQKQAPLAGWKQTKMLRTFWCEPPAEEKNMIALVNESFNLTWCPWSALDMVARHGLRAMIHDETLLKPAVLDNPAKKKQLDAMIDKARLHKAMECYWLADEPKEDQFKDLARLMKYLQDRDPSHFGYINVLPIYAFSEQGYVDYLRKFIGTVKPKLFTFAHYPFFKMNDGLQYFQNLEIVRRESKAANIPFLGIIQASNFDPSWRLPTADELRWFVYTNLAYGSKGISYFLYWGPKHYGGLYQDGKAMPLLSAASQLNSEIEAMDSVLLPLSSKGVFHTNPLPLGTQAIPVASPVLIADRGHGQFMLGFFEGANGAQYVMVVNRDYKSARKVVLEVKNGMLQKEFDRKTKKFIAAPGRDWFGKYSLQLAAGDGRLFLFGK